MVIKYFKPCRSLTFFYFIFTVLWALISMFELCQDHALRITGDVVVHTSTMKINVSEFYKTLINRLLKTFNIYKNLVILS